MAQTPALLYSEGDVIDYTPGSAVIAGQVIELNSALPLIAPEAIAASVQGTLACSGVWKVPQAAEIQTAGNPVYWDNDGTPVTGTAASGAATATASGNLLMGTCVETTAATDSYVKVKLDAVRRTATIAGSCTATDLTGSDASLAIGGQAAAQGGAIAIAGGTSSTAENAGGAITITGGTPGTTGVGGAVSVTGGAGGSVSGTGGAVTVAGGAGTAGNANGGALTLRGGNAHGSGTDGAIAIGDANTATVTFGVMPRVPVATVAVGGTAIGNANAVTEGFTAVTGANDTAAIKLPAAVAGAQCIVQNTVANKILCVFPTVGDAINAGAANAVYNMANGSLRTFTAYDGTTWYTDPETIA